MTETMTSPRPVKAERADRDLHAATTPFAVESTARSWGHLAETFLLLAGALTAAALLPWWPARLAASLVGALIMVRAFILYHDFMHGAILSGSTLARAIFYVYAALNLAPPRSWRASHNFHHANVGRIPGSDIGSFPIMTTDEWRRTSFAGRLAYRAVRNPVMILCAYATVFLFSICLLPLLRMPAKHWDSGLSLLAHGGAIAALWHFGGFDVAFYTMLLPMAVSSALGGYLFYAQHSFPGMRIIPEDEWNRYSASLVSSSYMRLPPVMRWFTGNIGYHHVHHLNPLIPFYALPPAMDAIPELQHATATSLRPRDVIACFRANLWDEQQGRMVRYCDAATAA